MAGSRFLAGLVVLCFLWRPEAALTHTEMRAFAGSSWTYVNGAAIAPNGESYMAGLTDGNLDSHPYSGTSDAYIRKLKADRSFAWTRFFDRGTTYFYNLDVDPAANAYACGTTNGHHFSPPQGNDFMIVKVDRNGKTVWGKQYGGSEYGADALAIYACGLKYRNGYLYTAYRHTTTSFLVLKLLAATGEVVWKYEMASSASLEFRSDYQGADILHLAANGDILITAHSTATYGPTVQLVGGLDTGHESQNRDVIVFKLDTHGKLVWRTWIGSTSHEYVNGITTDELGDVYVCGTTAGTLHDQISYGSEDPFVVKLGGEAGIRRWTRVFDQKYSSVTSGQCSAIAADGRGGVYYVNSKTGYNLNWLVRIDLDGIQEDIWEERATTSSTTNYRSLRTSRILFPATDSVVLSGQFYDSWGGTPYSGGEFSGSTNGYMRWFDLARDCNCTDAAALVPSVEAALAKIAGASA